MSSERVGSDKKTSGQTSTGDDVQRQARASAQQRDAASSQDPEVLARQIEDTREDLAETLDAIADRVSPKRVASRTRESLAETVKEKTAQAKVAVNGTTTAAKRLVNDKTAAAKQAVEQRRQSSGPTAASNASSVRLDADLPPVSGVEVPGLAPRTGGGAVRPTSSSAGSSSPLAGVPPQALAGAGAAVVGLLLLLRRRRKRS